jgi:ABC-2 type transport system permease protein
MRKILTIAARDYLATVRSRYFTFCILLVPVVMCGSVLVSKQIGSQRNLKERKFAVVDRTPGGELFAVLDSAVQKRNASQLRDPKTNEQIMPAFALEKIEPSADTPDAINRQRLELSDQVRKDKIAGILEIGPDIEKEFAKLATPSDRTTLRYQSDNVAAEVRFDAFPRWAERVINEAVRQKRYAAAGLSAVQMQEIQRPVTLVSKTLSRENAATGRIEETSEGSVLARYGSMMTLVMLMYLGIVLCASFTLQAVLEEKMQRIAEILLGSVRPFELMMGKLLGLGGASLTITAIYFGGLYWVARWFGWLDYLPSWDVIPWFLVFFVLGILLYGSVSMAMGSSSTDMKEANMLFTPVLMIAVLPLMLLPLIQDEPNGALAIAFSLFPPTAPTFMMARMAFPTGLPIWQPILSVVLLLGATLATVWGAGRIFRVGILMHGKGAKFGDLFKWLVQG